MGDSLLGTQLTQSQNHTVVSVNIKSVFLSQVTSQSYAL